MYNGQGSSNMSSNASVGTEDVDLVLRRHDDNFALQVLPAILYLSVLVLVGVVGNVIVCYIYICKFKRSSTRCFIVALAVYDLMNCFISIPVEIVDMRHSYTFGSFALCKVARVFVAFTSVASGFVLLAVAVDRYKKICRPLKSQTTAVISKVSIILCSLSAFMVALPAFVIYGGKTVTTDDININGSDCSTADEVVGTPYPLIYNGVQFLIFLSAAVTLVVLYSLIWKQVRRQQTFRESFKVNQGRNRATQHIFTSMREADHRSDSMDTSEGLLSSSDGGLQMSATHTSRLHDVSNKSEKEKNSHESDTQRQGKSRKSSLWKKASFALRRGTGRGDSISSRGDRGVRRTTFMLFLITLVFVLSYFPHLALMATRAIHKSVFENLQGGKLAAYNLFLRSYFFNSACNPIIYSLCNGHFRRELKQLVRRLTCRT